MSRLSVLLERLVTSVEGAAALDAPSDAIQKLTGTLPPGKVKDALSGTPIGHPLHPVLVAVPIGAFSSAVVLDLLGGDEPAARRLVGLGILSSIPAAAAGVTDWSDTQGAERRVGLAHAALNDVALGLLGLSWFARRTPGRGKILALAGFGVLGASGWLGGHLAYAMGVGVDTTAFSPVPQDWADACAAADLVDGKPIAVDLDGTSVLLIRRGGAVFAMANRCTHRGGPLNEGPVVEAASGDDACIECPWHGSQFRLTDGSVERGPATRPQPTLETRVDGDRIQVRRTEPKTLRTNPI